jgi:chitinase
VRTLTFLFTVTLALAQTDVNPAAGKRVIGYFAGWNASRGYTTKNIETSGSAAKLTHINYAFGNVAGGRCAVTSASDDYERAFNAPASVDGRADDPSAARAARGNFGQLLKLKALHPNLKVLISLGGWTGSGGFSSAVETEASRKALVSSCIDLFIRGNLPNGMTAAGLFDGIDIDWEYPGTCGLQCGVPEDAQRFTDLVAEFRRQLDAEGQLRAKHYALTIAAPAGTRNYIVLELRRIAGLLDFINLMTYDYHESEDPVTNHLAPLQGSKADPTYSDYGWIDATVADFLAAGVPADKLVLGLPFYGAGWKDVPDVNHGMYQRAGGPAQGHGTFTKLQPLEGFELFRDPETQAAWLYNPATHVLWTYEDPVTIATKMQYVKKRGLGGAMFWELSDDDARGTLLGAVAEGLK